MVRFLLSLHFCLPSVDVGVERRSPSAYQRSPCVLANLWRRRGGVHVAEEVLDPPKGDAAARVSHLQTEPLTCLFGCRWFGLLH